MFLSVTMGNVTQLMETGIPKVSNKKQVGSLFFFWFMLATVVVVVVFEAGIRQ
jgi:hypothetical protein